MTNEDEGLDAIGRTPTEAAAERGKRPLFFTTTGAAPHGVNVITVRGIDADGREVTESIDVPRLSPEEEARAERAQRMLCKIRRGAYHTRRRLRNAERRYFRMFIEAAKVATVTALKAVTAIEIVTAPTATDGCAISIGSVEAAC